MLLFMIGFWAPGVPKLNYRLVVNDDEDRDVESTMVKCVLYFFPTKLKKLSCFTSLGLDTFCSVTL